VEVKLEQTGDILTPVLNSRFITRRPFNLRLQDWISSYIVSWFTALFWKAILLSFLTLIVWLFGFQELEGTLLLPLSIFVGWFLIYLFRGGVFYNSLGNNRVLGEHFLLFIDRLPATDDQKIALRKVFQKLLWSPGKVAVVMLALFVSFGCMYAVVEALLRNCHGTGNGIPSPRILIAGAFGPPLLNVLFSFVAEAIPSFSK
jgi:hypothetical protein